ncbi:hypothetical_protein [Leishmania braziliensis MHOM/BR/75/M2904]|nr:hypothetical_protein [Leishmania braziliensis MHOM/BR/75/M2904]
MMLSRIMEGLTQPPQITSNVPQSLGLLLALSMGPLPLIGEHIIAVYLALQLVWWLLLWNRSVRAVESQSTRRQLEEKAKEAWLKWMDVLRFGVAELVCHHLLRFEVGGQVCLLYCSAAVLRVVAKPFFYVVVRLFAEPQWASQVTGYDPASLLESIGWGEKTEFTSGPAWKQHGQAGGAGAKATSAQMRVSSLAPTQSADSAKNNNSRCKVLDEGLHFNRTARGCLLQLSE